MYHWVALNRETFLSHYHKRSYVESAFHMIKSKFGDSVRSKGETAQENEVLAKVLCHNIVVLIHAMRSLGVEPNFRESQSKRETVAAEPSLVRPPMLLF